MNVLIVEDEMLAAERLRELLLRHDAAIRVLDVLDTVEDTVQWLLTHPEPDLILMDIHLADGLSFAVFNSVHVKCPIIFTTAYDQYAIQAFKVNSIDYLLKPVSYQGMAQALHKMRSLSHGAAAISPEALRQVTELIGQSAKNYKSRFLVRFGDHLQYKNVQDVSYFYADGKVVYLVTNDNKRFIVEYTLEELEVVLDPTVFHRINRKVIVHLEAVRDVRLHSNSRLRLSLRPTLEGDVVVSREKVSAFKAWLDK
ncbi:MAG: LytTR family DNA-binding domain-containing protein [Cytophagales bacterium]|nr:LytTR family DNA-binding domain-containing protein [Cytophagales bacterium]